MENLCPLLCRMDLEYQRAKCKERVFLSCNSHVFYFSPQMSVFESTLLVQNTRMDSVGFIWLEFH